MSELNKEAILEWVEALESGEYQQTTGTLAKYVQGLPNPISYCCLGVACDLFKDRLGLKVEVDEQDIAFDGEYSSLPVKVQKFLGLSGEDPHVRWEEGVTSLASLNDNYSKTFPEIAAILRANFLTKEDNHDQRE